MKKVILLVLSLVLALACAVSSFAGYYGVVKFDKAVNRIGQSFNDGGIQYDENEIRNDWTASRSMPGTVATFVNLGDDTNKNVAVNIKGTEFIDSDQKANETDYMYATVDMKVNAFGKYAGFNIYGNSNGIGSATTSFDVTYDGNGNTILNSGFGFSVVAKDTVRLYVYGSGNPGSSPDYADLTIADFDATAAMHTYAIFADAAKKEAYVRVDGKTIGMFKFDDALGADIGIYAVNGGTGATTAKATDTNNGMFDACCVKGKVVFAAVGESSDVTIDNIGYGLYTFDNASLDSINFEGPAAPKQNFGEGDGDGSIKMDKHGRKLDASNGEVEKIKFIGWAGFSQEIKEFGYKIDDGEPVFDATFAIGGEQAIHKACVAGGAFAKRFGITVPISEFEGEHKVVAVAKLADDTVIALDSALDAWRHDLASTKVDTTFTFVYGKQTTEPEVPANAYLKETIEDGKVDLLAGLVGKYIANENGGFNGKEITVLTDGVIAASKDAQAVKLDRIHMNDQWCKHPFNIDTDKIVEFAGVEGKFCYAVEYSGLDKVSFDSFDIYFSRQKDDADNLVGRDISGSLTEKDVVLLYSTDGGKTYAVAYDSSKDADKTAGTFGDDVNSFIQNQKPTANDTTYEYRLGTRTLDKTYSNVTNIVFASPSGKGSANAWPAATSELNVWAAEAAPADEPYEGYVGASFDSINVNGTLNFGAGDGKASEKMQPVDGTKGDVKSVTLRGWAGFDQAIKAFGYRINGKDTFVDGKDFKFTTEDAVRLPENGGANGSRFAIEIPTADLKGKNTIVALVKLADDTVIVLDGQFDAKITAAAGVSPNTTFTFNGPAEGGNKPTSDVAVAFAVAAVAAMAVVVLKKRETI